MRISQFLRMWFATFQRPVSLSPDARDRKATAAERGTGPPEISADTRFHRSPRERSDQDGFVVSMLRIGNPAAVTPLAARRLAPKGRCGCVLESWARSECR